MSELYELPDGWEWKPLEKIGKVFSGSSAPQKEEYFVDGKYPFIRTKDLATYGRTNNLTDIDDYINEECINNSKLVLAKKGTTLFPKSGASIGTNNRAMIGLDSYIVSHLGAFYSHNEVTNKYIYNYFLTIDLLNYCENPSYPSLKISRVKEIDIPLPPLSEQQRIVSKLDNLFKKIDKSIALHQKNMNEANAFMGSILNDVFNGLNTKETVPLKRITSKIGSGSTPRGGQKAYKTEGISLIRSMNVHDYGFRKKGLAFIDDEQAKKLDNVTIQKNDVLLNITGASVTRCCIVDENYLPARVNQHVSILRLKDEMISSFLHYYLISPSVKSKLLESSSGGATREAITKSMLEEFQVPLVSLTLQEKIVTYLDEASQKIEKIKSVQKEKMESLAALKASILDQAFKGKL